MDDDGQKIARTFVQNLLLGTITMDSDRDLQRMPGPSDLADPCDFCVVEKLTNVIEGTFGKGVRSFSLKAWIGTAVHEKLERDLEKSGVEHYSELHIQICSIAGLGKIKGHVDLYVPQIRTLVDFKTSDLKRIQQYRLGGVPLAHRGQTMMYGYGLQRCERPVDHVILAYIPRDSNKETDIWVAASPYREDVALGRIRRIERFMEKISTGDVADVTPDPSCYVCSVLRKYARM